MEKKDVRQYFAIGDVQGCMESLTGLLEDVPSDSRVVFVGDIVNRGPQSLEVLDFIYENRDRFDVVLGNHDLHLIAVAAGAGSVHRKDTISEILEHPKCEEWIDWLRRRPLLIEEDDAVFVHAGIPPQWTLDEARSLAEEARTGLSSSGWRTWISGMYGNSQPADVGGEKERMRGILNGFTRMRFVDAQTGSLDFSEKGSAAAAPEGLIPWFDFKRKEPLGKPVCFGHWSTLGLVNRPDVIAIDTGCLWGGRLTAVRFPDRKIIQEVCPQWANPHSY